MKKFVVTVKKSDLHSAVPRMGVIHTKVVPDKTKYNRKSKNQKWEA